MGPRKLSGAQNKKKLKCKQLENKMLANQWGKWLKKSNQ
jgi:hypothetical protein